jgi:hypothetical protein
MSKSKSNSLLLTLTMIATNTGLWRRSYRASQRSTQALYVRKRRKLVLAYSSESDNRELKTRTV